MYDGMYDFMSLLSSTPASAVLEGVKYSCRVGLGRDLCQYNPQTHNCHVNRMKLQLIQNQNFTYLDSRINR